MCHKLSELREAMGRYAARRGELSPAQAAAIADASAFDPEAEAELLAKAGKLSLKELQEEAGRKKAAHDDLESRRDKIHRSRHLRTYTDPEGAAHLHLRDNPEVVAKLMGVVTPIRDRLAKEAAAEGRTEPWRPTPPTPWQRPCAGAEAR